MNLVSGAKDSADSMRCFSYAVFVDAKFAVFKDLSHFSVCFLCTQSMYELLKYQSSISHVYYTYLCGGHFH